MRAAVVGGTAYYAGKRAQEGRYREDEQEARLEQLEAQQMAPPPPAAAPAPAAPTGISNEAIQQLQQLAALKEQGVLSEEEFEIQKRRLLGTA
jgi:hypothetical protein